jgi:hypothetical protein
MTRRATTLLAFLASTLGGFTPVPAPAAAPGFGQPEIRLGDKPAPPPSSSSSGFALVAEATGPQVAILGSKAVLFALGPGEQAEVIVSIECGEEDCGAEVEVLHFAGGEVRVGVLGRTGGKMVQLPRGERWRIDGLRGRGNPHVRLRAEAVTGGDSAVLWRNLRVTVGQQSFDVPIAPPARKDWPLPAPELPPLRPAVEQALIEWDWRMQDGIGTERNPAPYAAAIEKTLKRGDELTRDLQAAGAGLAQQASQWQKLHEEWTQLTGDPKADEAKWESLWRRVHEARRRMAFANPLAKTGPLLFVKQVPSVFSHQLTQYYGACAKPGGGVFVLDKPGESMAARQLAAGQLPVGSYQHPELACDGKRVLFSFCATPSAPPNRTTHLDRFYHLYEMNADGSGLRQLTSGPYDDFSPRYLPDGRIIFISTRRGGFHRCGAGPCPVYTLAIANPDGSDPHPVSYHETHEWDPAVLGDGRVIYTRWDYVDRNAVHYQQLWTVRPDGSDPRAFYGNNTLHPVGVWEPQAVPGSPRVMATAAAHHAMTAGSIILLDVAKGIDGLGPITRLTPDALFSESEAPVSNGAKGFWHAPAGVTQRFPTPPEQERWPGHCYRSPWPLSEKYFLAAYSFDALIGEPHWNPPNMFGIYLVDAFGNKELLYRDMNIASLWPMPLRPRLKAPTIPTAISELINSEIGTASPSGPSPAASAANQAPRRQGTYFLQDVYASFPPLPRDSVKRLRIVQVLPKTTPHANNPPLGVANASPGKQVLGTVPVEADGSAYFRAPAGLPLSFQALDERGMAVQVMRSVTYLQPGENAACVGCHEPRTAPPHVVPRLARPAVQAPPDPLLDKPAVAHLRETGAAKALSRPPSAIEPGPDGSKPLSYPILVQPVLDKHCVSCHSKEKPEGKVILTGEPQGHYTASYNALGPRVSYAAWGAPRGNCEPLAVPGYFGARGSPATKCFTEAHYKVALSPADLERVVTWMDANGLFYGTFDPADQARQLRGERIAGPKLE